MEAENTDVWTEDASPSAVDDSPSITAVVCSPERTVFTEEDNDDGWISTNTTVDVER